MKEYFFKVRKKGTQDSKTTIYGVTNPEAYKKQMKEKGYTVFEHGLLKPNWRQIQENAMRLRMGNNATDADRSDADRIDASAIEVIYDCTTCHADCSFAGKSKGIRVAKNCHHYQGKKG